MRGFAQTAKQKQYGMSYDYEYRTFSASPTAHPTLPPYRTLAPATAAYSTRIRTRILSCLLIQTLDRGDWTAGRWMDLGSRDYFMRQPYRTVGFLRFVCRPFA